MKARRLASLRMCFGAPCLSQPAPLLEESVRKLAAARVAAGAYPSLVIGVVRGSRQEILAYGSIADDPKSKPNGDTVYEIGSVTKTFTALLLADAVQRGDVTRRASRAYRRTCCRKTRPTRMRVTRLRI